MRTTALIALVAMLALTGCAQKEVVTEPVLVPAPVWKFQKLKADVQGNIAIKVKSKEEQRICTPYVVEATDVLYIVIDSLEEQFDVYEQAMIEYNKSIK